MTAEKTRAELLEELYTASTELLSSGPVHSPFIEEPGRCPDCTERIKKFVDAVGRLAPEPVLVSDEKDFKRGGL